ncbi:Short-chain dehydrogenase [Granulicella rosea]|uniref:Short-chain dehydrogenase n=1 Tax=Granulicella rosea TaxID=474952 RepID=A0A239EBH2_9BACT|nr:oxidoreductase [Granulicella rosea]SNS41947.1 Short-chain dehydrogenase [Granulicella rosea]
MSKVWFITGSSRGIGLDITKAALAAGQKVVATARDASAVTKALGEQEDLLTLDLDVTKSSDAESAVKMTIAKFGTIDVLVNNAGYGHFGPFEEASAEDVAKQFDVNLFGAMHVTRAVLPEMRRKRSGRVFNISSIAGLQGFGMSSLYCSSKFALAGWSESLSMELEPLGIQVTCVEPGFFRTEFLGGSSVQYVDAKLPEYEGGVKQMREWLDGKHQTQEGDPTKLAAALLQLVATEKQPAHLLMGSDALQRMLDRIACDTEETQRWKSVSVSTDF